MRITQLFNDSWLFLPEKVDNEVSDSEFEPITLPHTNKLLPVRHFDSSEYSFVSTYRKHFSLPDSRNNRRVYLDFDGAMLASTVTINNHSFPEYRGGYTPFSFDITDYLHDDSNTVTVHLDSRERDDIPPFGHVVDYLTFGGIYRDVRLRMVSACHIKQVFIHPEDVLSDPKIGCDVVLCNQQDANVNAKIIATVKDANQTIISELETSTSLTPQEIQTVTLNSEILDGIKLWSVDAPHLYIVEFQLLVDDTIVDTYDQRFGFRDAHFDKDGKFYLNGEPLYLFGLNRHQTYPFIGAAAPARLQRKDADILKYELGCNIARTSHYPQSPHFLDRCDEIGLLVFEEIPGWQHIGDTDWQALSIRDVRAMIERDRNRPSIILWGVRINESLDNDEFYVKTNSLARELDPTRQTAGVRYFQDSSFLEDVFTFNDFSNGIAQPQHVPHLVTEFNGHMFPTKIWDQEERLVEHALRHVKIHHSGMATDGVSGTIAWCAFDYNTHQQFGSGDRICYHGVMDIFRIPKLAGAFYASQVSPDTKVVLQPATVWAMGERDASVINPLVVFSNCDELEVFVGEHRIGKYRANSEDFPHLSYPPFMIPMGTGNLTWGSKFPDLKIQGYVNGKMVCTKQIDSSGLPAKLTLELDDSRLIADGMDMTRAIIKLTDKYGNRIPFSNQVITVEVEGAIDLIGQSPISIFGGQTAVYIKTKHESGTASISVRSVDFEDVTQSLELLPKSSTTEIVSEGAD